MSSIPNLLKVPPFFAGQMGVPGSSAPMGLRFFPGDVYYVDQNNTLASNSNDGTDPSEPLLTLAAAIAKCTANHHDTIYVAAYHRENIATAAAINANKAGITIIGLGYGENRPTYTFTAIASTLAISSADVTIQNFLFKVATLATTMMIDVNAKDFTLEYCEFREGTEQWVSAVDIGGGANGADRAKVRFNKFTSVVAGATNAINIGAVEDALELVGNWIYGDYGEAAVYSASVFTNMLLAGNDVSNDHAAKWAVEFTAAGTGEANDNRLYTNSLATCFDPGSLKCNGNLATSAIDTSGATIPATSINPLAGTNQVLKGAIALPQTNQTAIFNINGGRVAILGLIGEVTTNIGAFANLSNFVSNPTVGIDIDLCTTVTLNGILVGIQLGLSGVPADALVVAQAGCLCYRPVVVSAGSIDIKCGGNDGGGGRMKFSCFWMPIDAGATVTAA